MKLAAILLFFASALPIAPLLADDGPPGPLAGAFFPPELVSLAADQLGLSAQQREALHTQIDTAQTAMQQIQRRLEHETATLATLARQVHADQAALSAQLDKVLDAERDAKHLQLGLLAGIKNLLTPEQQISLHEIAKNGSAKIGEEIRQRISGKVEAVQAGVRKWLDAGRDPSGIGQTMEQKVKPLLDAGNPADAEAILDDLVKQLNQDTQ